tara:strand:- start:304 stop:960 length:657 start_codon:yes stop_codon:yes gene_type:complete
LSELYTDAKVHAFSRSQKKSDAENIVNHTINYNDEVSIEQAASQASKEAPLDIVIVATGILFDGNITPEKSLRELSAKKFLRLFEVNTILPALIAKHFLPKLNKQDRSIFAALSARVGSVSDNKLGGWYSYRASKSGLNMIIKNAAIEINRQNKNAIIVGLHPGTVDSNLSKPFQGNVPDGKLFTPDHSVKRLLDVLGNLTPESSGKFFSWDGKEVQP